ncbi:MAG: DNA-binding domain-containing protein [Pseudomonadota bacterium]
MSVVPSLPELQRAFSNDLHGESASQTERMIKPGKFSSERLIQVYRNNFQISLTTALRDIYPTIDTLVGEGFFNYLANAYISAHPSRHGNLHEFGSSLTEFLGRFEAASSLPYLSDVASVDWASHRAFHAADTQAVSQKKLAQIAPTDYPALKFKLSESTTLISSEFPTFSIWQFAQRDNPNTEPPAVDGGGECVLVHRPRLESEVFQITGTEYRLLFELKNEQTLGAAVERAVTEESNNMAFDLNNSLQRFFAAGVVSDVWLD